MQSKGKARTTAVLRLGMMAPLCDPDKADLNSGKATCAADFRHCHVGVLCASHLKAAFLLPKPLEQGSSVLGAAPHTAPRLCSCMTAESAHCTYRAAWSLLRRRVSARQALQRMAKHQSASQAQDVKGQCKGTSASGRSASPAGRAVPEPGSMALVLHIQVLTLLCSPLKCAQDLLPGTA